MLLLVLYLIGGLMWLMIMAMIWGVDRDFPDLHSEEDIAMKARRVLQTPVWPFVALGMAGRAIANLQRDAMRD